MRHISGEQSIAELGLAVLGQAISDYKAGTSYVRDGVVDFFESGNYKLFCMWANLSCEKVYSVYKGMTDGDKQKRLFFSEGD